MRERNFFFTVRETGEGKVEFRAPEETLYAWDGLELLVERAANVYFFGHGGHLCANGWPLTFTVGLCDGGGVLGTMTASILDGQIPPTFDII